MTTRIIAARAAEPTSSLFIGAPPLRISVEIIMPIIVDRSTPIDLKGSTVFFEGN
jgi:hypothetical protein